MATAGTLTEYVRNWPQPAKITHENLPQISFSTHPERGYVWPGADVVEEQANAGALLIQAPGAVGKSAAAKAFASVLNWPLVDSSKAQVGSYSLSGLMQDALGFGHSFLKDLSEGRTGLIVDALDEAQLRAGTQNFLEFLRNVAQLSASREDAPPRIVLLSRPDTGELIRSFFAEVEMPLNVRELNFFTYDKALQYIEERLNVLHEDKPRENRYGLALRHFDKFIELRDKRLAELANILTNSSEWAPDCDWRSVQKFLGYAPVLSVITEYLCPMNFTVELRRDFVQARGPRDVLLRIVTNLLEREQGKFRSNVLPALLAKLSAAEEWPQYTQSYGIDEQVARIIDRTAGLAQVIDLPASVPSSIRADYQERAASFVKDHPFLSGLETVNSVFNDFIIARQLRSPVVQASLGGLRVPGAEEVGPFFFQFLGAMDDANNQPVPEAMLPAIIASHSQAMTREGGSISLVQVGGTGSVLLTGGMADDGLDFVTFELDQLSGVFVFPVQLSRIAVVTDAAVVLGGRQGIFSIGPEVIVVADEVVISAERISVLTEPYSSRPTVIQAKTILIEGPLRVDSPTPAGLVVVCPQEWPQLAAFQVKAATFPSTTIVKYADYMNLRSILRFFKQQAGSSPSIFADKLEQGIVKNNPVRRRFLQGLLDRQIIERIADHYYLNTEKLSEEGISMASLNSGEPDESVLSLISKLST